MFPALVGEDRRQYRLTHAEVQAIQAAADQVRCGTWLMPSMEAAISDFDVAVDVTTLRQQVTRTRTPIATYLWLRPEDAAHLATLPGVPATAQATLTRTYQDDKEVE